MRFFGGIARPAMAERVVRIFWPASLGRARRPAPSPPAASASSDPPHELLLGWAQSCGRETHIVVAGTVSPDREADLHRALAAANARQQGAGAELVVLGALQHGARAGSAPLEQILTVSVGPRDRATRRSVLHLRLSQRYEDAHTVVVLYDPPLSDQLRFLTIEPLRLSPAFLHDEVVAGAQKRRRGNGLAVAGAKEAAAVAATSTDATRARQSAYEDGLRQKLIGLQQLEGVSYEQGTQEAGLLRLSIALLNQATTTVRLVTETRSSLAAPSAAAIPAQPNVRYMLLRRVLSEAATLLVAPLHFLRAVAAQPLLLQHSLTARQVELRLSQITVWPSFAASLRTQRRRGLAPVSALSADYITLWGGLWLVANDLVFGHATAAVLRASAPLLAPALSAAARRALYEGTARLLAWLEAWPGGLKLNTELARFFGDVFRGLLALFHACVLAPLEAHTHLLLRALAAGAQYAGLTMALALLADALALATLHLALLHGMARFLYAGFLRLLGALFHLFRGKKRNPLRGGRLDDAAYEADQMLLGTILFTLLLFLFPTVAVYSCTLAAARWAAIAAPQAALRTALAVLNHVPLFALLLRVKDPARLPAGISLREVSDTSLSPRAPLCFLLAGSSSPSTGTGSSPGGRDAAPAEAPPRALPTLQLSSVPLGVARIFDGYGAHLAEVRQLPRLALEIVTGGSMSLGRRGTSM